MVTLPPLTVTSRTIEALFAFSFVCAFGTVCFACWRNDSYSATPASPAAPPSDSPKSATTSNELSAHTRSYSGYLPVVTDLFFVTFAVVFTMSAASGVQPCASGFQSCQNTSWPYSSLPHLPSYFALNASSLVVSRGSESACVFGTCLPFGHATGVTAWYLIVCVAPLTDGVTFESVTRPT